MKTFDLLSAVEYGGCSAKLAARELSLALEGLPKASNKNVLVDIETHDDAGVYRISDDLALIQTTDFFPPVCSDPYEFGQIAAANALSDVYAMGGEVMTALNIVAFPATYPLEVLKEILKGGIDKVIESGGVMIGGHTIVDAVPKYGLAVTGSVHPDRIITNAAAKPGDNLILTKPVGAGVIMAAHRIGEARDSLLRVVLDSMKQLNKEAATVMQEFNVRCATDITGYGLAGHALKMAVSSNVTLHIHASEVPAFDTAIRLIDMGCIPGACFRNLDFTDNQCVYSDSVSYNHKMLSLDPQTSGGLLICCSDVNTIRMVERLKEAGYPHTAVIGNVSNRGKHYISFE
ncbi:MAG: selenide, water dikinase SelD [Bacteroidales bacterium]|nr:selenide, water dikinase SelD [Bacteroidales bacterium]